MSTNHRECPVCGWTTKCLGALCDFCEMQVSGRIKFGAPFSRLLSGPANYFDHLEEVFKERLERVAAQNEVFLARHFPYRANPYPPDLNSVLANIPDPKPRNRP